MGVDARMYVATDEPTTDEQVLEYSYRLASALGAGNFDIDRARGRHALSRASAEDMDIGHPSTILEVNWLCRYYGPNYERGPIDTIVATGELLKRIVPNSTVYYCGDNSYPEPFDPAALLDHAAKVGRDPYHMIFGRSQPSCHCDFCNKPMPNFGGGRGEAFYQCLGCGLTSTIQVATGERTDKEPS